MFGKGRIGNGRNPKHHYENGRYSCVLTVHFSGDTANEAIETYRNDYAGFFVLLTTKFKDPLEALRVYREKDVVEKCFDDLKNGLDMKRLRVHLSGRMKSRMFIQFVSLILTSRIRKTAQEKLPSSNYTPRSMLLELESLTTIRYTGKYKNRLVEATKSQREILAAFGIDPQTSL